MLRLTSSILALSLLVVSGLVQAGEASVAEIAQKLGLPANATPEQVMKAIEGLQNAADRGWLTVD